MITDVSKAVVLVDDRDEARAAWSGQAGVDATLQGTRRRGALDRGDPASSVPEPGAGSRGSRTPTATAPRQAGPAGPPTTGISFGLTTVTMAWVTGRLCIADRTRWLLGPLALPTPAPDSRRDQATQGDQMGLHHSDVIAAARAMRDELGTGVRVIMSGMDPVNVDAMLARFAEHWSPKKIAQINDYDVRIVKLQGDFTWHKHDDTDELFLVLSGELTIQMRDRDVVLGPRDLFVVPRGAEHCPRADVETAVLLLEPSSVINTGDAGGEFTAEVETLS